MSLRFAEGKVTQLRREFKILLDEAQARILEAKLCEVLRTHRPEPTRITSVYFDGPGHPLTLRAKTTPHDTLKVRTKEYFPDVGAGGMTRVVLEAKRERNGMTRKKRLWMPRERLSSVFVQGSGVLPLIVRGRLLPVLGVTYQRHVFQQCEAWRVTFDTDVAFHALSPALALGPQALRRELLNPPLAREPRVVVEVKHLGATLPSWLLELGALQAHAYSKFNTGMTYLLREGSNALHGG
jgi:hypothetical protein